MNTTLKLVVEQTANDEKRDFILASIRAFNDQHSPYHQAVRAQGGTPLDIYAYDANNQLLAGLVGETFWGWLAIDYLWVTPEHRRFGLGSLLVTEAETLAIQRQCTAVKVSTFSFQAPGFYQKLGYEQVGQLDNYPPGEAMFWLRKTLPCPDVADQNSPSN